MPIRPCRFRWRRSSPTPPGFQKRYVPNVEEVSVAKLEGEGRKLCADAGKRRARPRPRRRACGRHLLVRAYARGSRRAHPRASSPTAPSIARSRSSKAARSPSSAAARRRSTWRSCFTKRAPRCASSRARPHIEYNKVPDAADETLIGRNPAPRLRHSAAAGGRCSALQAPLLFHRLPQSLKRRAIDSHMHPAAGWFMRDKVEGVIPMSLGCTLAKAEQTGGQRRAHRSRAVRARRHSRSIT